MNLLLRWQKIGGRAAFLACVILTVVGGLALIRYPQSLPALGHAIVLPPIAINGIFLYLFGRTLLPGREPVITRFRRLEEQPLFPETRRYTRRLTVYWTLFFVIALSLSLILPFTVDLETWSWVVNLACPLTAALFFLLEYLYRGRFKPHFGPVSLTRTLRTVSRPNAWRLGREEMG